MYKRQNYDSGAATTAFPVELAANLPMNKVGHFVVASGADIPNYGRVRVRCSDRPETRETSRVLSQWCISRWAPPVSSARLMMLCYGKQEVLLPKDGPIAIGMAKEYERLCNRHGLNDALHLHKEGNLYNFYLKKVADPVQINSADLPGGSSSGVSRPVGTPP